MAQNSRVSRGAGATAQTGSRRSMAAGRRAAADDGMQHGWSWAIVGSDDQEDAVAQKGATIK